MVKIAMFEYPPCTWEVALEHFGIGSGGDSTPWHLVHEYDVLGPDYPLTSFAAIWYPDQPTALAAARTFTQLSQVVTDLCPWCHFAFPGFGGYPLTPRFNIYRGPRGEPLIPAIYWDWWNPDPPPGYSWL